jgi:hypothetical protein
MKCEICNEEQTIRSMAMHLRWSHPEIKTEEYIKKYGEFRPKKIKENQSKEKSFFECKICNEKMMHNRQLMHHITKKHKNISKEEYVIKYFLNNIIPTCKCGCGEKVKILLNGPNQQYHTEYIKGHWDWVKPGYNFHSDETKKQMRISAIKRIEKDKKNNIISPWHSEKSLINRNKNNIIKIQQRIKDKHNIICLNLNEHYSKKNYDIFKFKCLNCNYNWEQISFYPRCHKCNPPTYFGSSLEEKELVDFIKTLDNNIITNSRNIINPYELDIYIPNYNIAIEYNGLYWHSEKGGKYQGYHINKFKICLDKNIHLIQIFSDEWINKKEIVKSRLKNLLKQTPNKIYARKCKIKEISPKQKNDFLNQNHIQGEDKSKIKLGLFHDNELISVMTFGYPRKAIGKKNNSNNNEYELIRFCNKLNNNVIGGASKLLRFFIKYYTPTNIYSFADNRWSNPENNLYKNIGFNFKSYSQPGYWYTKDFLIRLHRFNFNKQKLIKYNKESNLTEFEIMDKLGYYRVWDCGVSRYEYVIS